MTQPETVDAHWGADAVDPNAPDLPGLKMRFLLDHLDTAGPVMEIGSGEGKVLRSLARHRPGLELHGCDIREPATEPECYRFHLVQDGSNVPLPGGAFDSILIFDVLEHVPDPAALLREAARLLRPGGRLVAFVPIEGERFSFYGLFRRLLGADTYVKTKEHIQAFSHSDLRRLVERDFCVREWQYAYHLLGHLMDAVFFAAARITALQHFWWQENAYYNDTANAGRLSRLVNALLRVGNRIAFYESRRFRRVRFGSAGALFSATARTDTGVCRDCNREEG